MQKKKKTAITYAPVLQRFVRLKMFCSNFWYTQKFCDVKIPCKTASQFVSILAWM